MTLAREFKRSGKMFRIITPYDAQRGAIEAALKHADLPWEDTVFNVDSFQGSCSLAWLLLEGVTYQPPPPA